MDIRGTGFEFDQHRIEELDQLRNAGYSLYPPVFERKATIQEIREKFSSVGHEKSEERVVTAGRLYTVRNHGKTIFADLGDEGARIQLYIRKNDIGEEQFVFFTRFIERGDIVGVAGHPFRTKLGELTVWADDIVLLTKSLNSLPEKFHGLTNVEKRYRQRYVDLIVNPESRETFRKRSRLISSSRCTGGQTPARSLPCTSVSDRTCSCALPPNST